MAKRGRPCLTGEELPDLPHTAKSYWMGCRCPSCVLDHRRKQRSYARKRRREGLPGLPPGDPRHGTQTGYGYCGCRCEECLTATYHYMAPYWEAQDKKAAAERSTSTLE